jgi:hypothetical protein
MDHYITNTWCEQYIEYIINILHLKKKWLNIRNWNMAILKL